MGMQLRRIISKLSMMQPMSLLVRSLALRPVLSRSFTDCDLDYSKLKVKIPAGNIRSRYLHSR